MPDLKGLTDGGKDGESKQEVALFPSCNGGIIKTDEDKSQRRVTNTHIVHK